MLKEDLSKLVDLLDSEEVIHIFKSNFRDDDVGFFGFLVFSNRRLIFIEERGDFVKSYHALKLVPFEEIAEIEVEKFKWEKTMAVAEKSGKKNFFYNIKEDASGLSVSADKAKGVLEFLIEDSMRKVRTKKVSLDFSELISVLASSGLKVSSFICPKCGSYLAMPKRGKSVKCFYCDNVTQVQDIVENLINSLEEEGT